ncbi:MAG: NUDIX domain-containing protein [Proteobacteria bacterium]|nr:NUDIX domain-containing protein [Pseudomonadota bacterium]
MNGEKPPVRRIARRTALENRVWRVDLDHIVDANGGEVPEYLVLSPRGHAAGTVGGIAVLPLLADGSLVLLRNWRHAIGTWSWEVAKGFVDEGETPAAAARRELAEETGLACGPDDLVPLGEVFSEPAALATAAAMFVARDCRPIQAHKAADDEVGLGKPVILTRAAADELVRSGGMRDAVSLLLLARLPALRPAR